MSRIVLVTCCAAVVAAFGVLTWSGHGGGCDDPPRELGALRALRSLRECQQRHHDRVGRYGSISDLACTSMSGGDWGDDSLTPVTSDVVLSRGYFFRVHLRAVDASPLGEWYAYAWPRENGASFQTFVVWANSFIYATRDAYEGTDAAPLPDAAWPASAGHARDSYTGRDGRVWRLIE